MSLDSPCPSTGDEEVNYAPTPTPVSTLPNVETTNAAVDPANDSPPTLQVQDHHFGNIVIDHEMPANENSGINAKLTLTKKKRRVFRRVETADQ